MSMTDNTNIDVSTTDDLDSFASEFFGGKSQKTSDNAKSEEPADDLVEDNGAPEQNQDEDTQEPLEDEQSENGAEEDTDLADGNDNKPAAKPKKQSRYQERINELVSEREAERRAREAIELKLQEALAKLEEKTDAPVTPKPANTPAESTNTGIKEPKPDDKNEDGTDKYPLGIYDPMYLKDNMEYLFASREAEKRQKEEQLAKQRELDLARSQLQAAWNEKLVDAQERYPDFRQKGENMLTIFEGIDQAYGEYLTDTIMEMDAGPDVFYYLANNLDEAKQIVDAGPRKATIALARLEATLSPGSSNKATNPSTRVKPTKAPTPPPQLKGSSVARPGVPPDTDNLDAFSREFFKK